MPLKPLDVIRTFDGTIRPPGPKMIVCIDPGSGLFFRINTEDKWQIPVKILQKDFPDFLKWDSFIECGEPIELDEFAVDEALRAHGVLGSLNHVVGRKIFDAIKTAKTISDADKETIRKALMC